MLVSVFLCRGLGQTVESIRQGPPPISFAEWTLQETEDESVSEYTLEFPSAFVTGIAENDTVPLRVVLPKNKPGPVPVVIVLHFWGAVDQKIERSLAGDLASKGIGSVLLTLPYHLQRTPKGFRSGEAAIPPDPAAMIKTMTQSVLDVRRAVDFVVSRPEFDASRIGIAGTSLGSVVSSLTFAVEPRIQAASFMLGGADLAHIIWNSSRLGKVRDSLRRQGILEAQLRETLRDVEPLNYLSERRTGGTFVIGGKFDTVIPPEDTRKLIQALPNPSTLWLETGHYGGVFVQRRVLRLVSQFFAGQFGGPAFTPPSSIYAPTLRIIIEANLESSFQVGVGLDIWKANARGDVFSTLIATPRGAQLFLGAKVDRGLAIGAFATTKRVSPGVMWSFVL